MALSNISGYINLWRLLITEPLRGFTFKHFRVYYKHLDTYIACPLSAKSRLDIVHGHYAYLVECFGKNFCDDLRAGAIRIWRRELNSHEYSINLSYPFEKAAEWEGELCLSLSYDGCNLYRLVFALLPIAISNINGSKALIIGSIQGKHCLPKVKQATNSCGGIHPSHLLMAAIGGVAVGLDIFEMIGVGDERQLHSGQERIFSYDRFFEHYAFYAPQCGFYQIKLPFEERVLRSKSASHRKRTMAKRAMKKELMGDISTNIRLLREM